MIHGIAPIHPLPEAAVLHGATTRVVLGEEAWRRRFGRPNPDTALLRELVSSGVKVHVCGQSLIEKGFDREELDSGVILASSALAVLAHFQLDGWALMSW